MQTTLLLALLATGIASCASREPLLDSRTTDARIERQLVSMGTGLTLVVVAEDRRAALAASEDAVRAIEAVEARLSTWDPSSELSQVNALALGSSLELSPELAADLARASALARETGGAFDPAVGDLVQAWGLREGGRRPNSEEIARAVARGGEQAFERNGTALTRVRGGSALEEGGFGKGVGLDAGLAALRAAGVQRGLLDLGGQLLAVPSAENYIALISDPRERDREVVELLFQRGSLATSGNSERAIVIDGESFGHLLDPRTGYPARDFGSVTVWAADATSADAYSTALFIMGPADGLRFAHRTANLEALFLEVAPDGLLARSTPGFRDCVRLLGDAVTKLTIDIPSD